MAGRRVRESDPGDTGFNSGPDTTVSGYLSDLFGTCLGMRLRPLGTIWDHLGLVGDYLKICPKNCRNITVNQISRNNIFNMYLH